MEEEKAKDEVKNLARKITDDKIKNLMNAKCIYPVHTEGGMKKCGKKQMMMLSLPLLQILEGGKVEPSESVGISVPFCQEHLYYVMGGFFGIIEQEGKLPLYGPFELVDIAKHVITAMAMNGELYHLIKIAEQGVEIEADAKAAVEASLNHKPKNEV